MVTRAQAVDTRLLFSPPTRPGNGANAVMYLDVGVDVWRSGTFLENHSLVSTFCIWSFAVCKYRGGRPGGDGHMRLYQVDRG